MGTCLRLAKVSSSTRGPVGAALIVLGLGVVLAVVVGLVYGLLIGNVGKGVWQAGAVVITIAAIAAIIAAYQSGVRRKRSSR